MQNSDKNSDLVKRQINRTLQGPVSVILSGSVPELSGISKSAIYDHVLNNLPVLVKSLNVLRTNRARFEDVLVNSQGKVVADDVSELSCGRSLNHVVGMVVRSATKRYFRSVATSDTPLPHLTSHADADLLYEAIRDYLMHDWQVPLVPTYAEMTPPIAREIGIELTLIQDETELRGLIRSKSGLDTATPPSTEEHIDQADPDPFAFYLSLDGRRMNIDAFESILENSDVKAAIGKVDIKAVLKTIGGHSARFLVYGMGLTPEQFVAIMAAAYESMGVEVFSRIMGAPGDREVVVKLAQYGMSKKINSRTPLSDCTFFIKNFVSQAIKSKVH